MLFFLLVFRKNSNKESDLSEDDIKTIRASLYGLVKYYISKGMSQEEMHSLLGYIAAIGDEDQVRSCGWKSCQKRFQTFFVFIPDFSGAAPHNKSSNKTVDLQKTEYNKVVNNALLPFEDYCVK